MSALLLLFLLLLVYWFWSDSLRARERAVQVSARACARSDLQFLDETVALARMGLGRDAGGHLRLRRYYGFELSSDGVARHKGLTVLLGPVVERVQLETPDHVTILDRAAEAD